MRRILCAWGVVLVGAFVLPISTAGAVSPATASPPASVPSNCSSDVSQRLQNWFQKLPAGTTVAVPPGACYLINEGMQLVGSQGLTVSGGTWEDETTPQIGTAAKVNNAEFWLVGGSDITLENMTITGANPGGYYEAGAFMAGIRSDGVLGLNVENVMIDHTYGDGIELNALRGAQDDSGTILNATKHVTISNVRIDGPGRQGITLASVNHAVISSVRLDHVGLNVFDVEADQGNEGAANVTIDGCTAGHGNDGLFFANGGAGGGYQTRNITVENCTMEAVQNGDAVLIQTPAGFPTPRGPFTFTNDTLRCGASVYVACVQVTGGDVSVNGSTVECPPSTIHEAVYNAYQSSAVSFGGDYVTGYGSRGTASTNSSVSVSGGLWEPYLSVSSPVPNKASAPPAPNPGRLTDETQSAPVQAASLSADRAPGASGEGSGSDRRSNTVLASDHREAQALSTALPQLDSREVAVVLLALSGLATAIALFTRRQRRVAVVAPSAIDMLGGSRPTR